MNMRMLRRSIRSERGATLVMVAMSMVFILGMAALAVDVGNLYLVRTELQRAADASALAGAGWLLADPDDSTGAVDEAISFASQNATGAQAFSIQDGDVDVFLDEFVVKTRVYSTADRSTAVPTFFARILGINTANIYAEAAAWAAPSTGVEPTGNWRDCLLPLGLLDYYDQNGNGEWDAGEPQLGYDTDDHGKLLKFSFSGSTGQGPPACRTEPPEVFNGTPNTDYCNIPSADWSCFWREDLPSGGGGGGSNWLGDAIVGEQCVGVEAGATVYGASAVGEKQSVISSDDGPGSFRDVIEQDLADNGNVDLVWCPNGTGGDSAGCPMRGDCFQTECELDNRRIRSAPIIDPETVTGGGATSSFVIDDFTGVFIEKVACSYSQPAFGGPQGNWNVYVRLLTSGAGAGPGPGDEAGEGTALIRSLRLIPYDAVN
ncbi:MAG: Tad domain-containing protein [Gemmatimonadota bacterium]